MFRIGNNKDYVVRFLLYIYFDLFKYVILTVGVISQF
jgi:hypothetical protein